MERYSNTYAGPGGQPIKGADVLVRKIDGSPATIWADNGITPLANPFQTGADGSLAFYAANGRYMATISKRGLRDEVVSDILLNDPADEELSLTDYAALRASAGKQTSVRITGYLASTKPDGVAGLFVRDDSDTTSVDNGGTVIVSSNGKRWKRVFDGDIDARWFGLKADGTTDDTAALQAAHDYAASLYSVSAGYGRGGQIVSLPQGAIKFTTLMRKNGVGQRGKGRYKTLLMMSQSGGVGFKCAAADSQLSADNVYWIEDSGYSLIPNPATTFAAPTILWNMVGFSRLTLRDIAVTCPNNVIGFSVKGATTAGDGGPAQWYNSFYDVFAEEVNGTGLGWDLGDTAADKEQITTWNWYGGRTSGATGIGMRLNSATGVNLFGHVFEGLSDQLIIGSLTGTRGCNRVNLYGCYFEGSAGGYTIHENAQWTRVEGGFSTGVTHTIHNEETTYISDEGIRLGNTASSDPKTLDWYEEGSFTPTVTGASTPGANTYAVRVGRFRRSGNQVKVQISIILASKDAAMAGSVSISGLPFAASPSAGSATLTIGNAYLSLDTGYTWPAARIDPGEQHIKLLECGSNKSVAQLTPANIFGTTELYIFGSYEV